MGAPGPRYTHPWSRPSAWVDLEGQPRVPSSWTRAFEVASLSSPHLRTQSLGVHHGLSPYNIHIHAVGHSNPTVRIHAYIRKPRTLGLTPAARSRTTPGSTLVDMLSHEYTHACRLNGPTPQSVPARTRADPGEAPASRSPTRSRTRAEPSLVHALPAAGLGRLGPRPGTRPVPRPGRRAGRPVPPYSNLGTTKTGSVEVTPFGVLVRPLLVSSPFVPFSPNVSSFAGPGASRGPRHLRPGRTRSPEDLRGGPGSTR